MSILAFIFQTLIFAYLMKKLIIAKFDNIKQRYKTILNNNKNLKQYYKNYKKLLYYLIEYTFSIYISKI